LFKKAGFENAFMTNQISQQPIGQTAWAAGALATLIVLGCSSQAAAQADAGRVAQELRAAPGGSATCPIPNAAELSALMGARVEEAIMIGGSCAFNYAGTDDHAAVLQIGSGRGFGPGSPRPAEYQQLPDIGDAAWIGRGYQNSWTARARRGDRFVHVNVAGRSAGREVAIVVLRAALTKI
jgi:hypothetical protein